MSYFQIKFKNPLPKSVLLLLGVIGLLTFLQSADAQTETTSLDVGFRQMYNPVSYTHLTLPTILRV